MKLVGMTVVGVRGLADAEYDLAPEGEPERRVIVTGAPGAGRTSFLRAIAGVVSSMATHVAPLASGDLIRRGGGAATITSTWWLDEAERRVGGLPSGPTVATVSARVDKPVAARADPALRAAMSRYEHGGEHSKVVVLAEAGASPEGGAGLTDFVAEQRRRQLALDASRFASFERALVDDASRRDGRAFERVRVCFESACTSAKLVGVERSRLVFETTTASGLRLPDLSRTERATLHLVAAPVLLGLARALVLLDAPEREIPDDALRSCLDAMMAESPDSQWIVATRSRALISATNDSRQIHLRSQP